MPVPADFRHRGVRETFTVAGMPPGVTVVPVSVFGDKSGYTAFLFSIKIGAACSYPVTIKGRGCSCNYPSEDLFGFNIDVIPW